MKRLILVRHGQSLWNQDGLFTGWTDVELSHLGRKQAMMAGQLLKENNMNRYRVAYTSVLKRAIDSLNLLLEKAERSWVDVYKDWRLNEKHYGTLQGKNKAQVMDQYGSAQVLKWRRAYNEAPPAMSVEDERAPYADERYRLIDPKQLPLTESLKQTETRLLPFWESTLKPKLRQQGELLVVAHGNSLRALMKIIKELNDEQVLMLNIPLAIPLVVEFDEQGEYGEDYYLGSERDLEQGLALASQV